MRLRLTIQRNGLPAANIIWTIPETNSTQAYTITRLLEDVNLVMPLEAEHWGLEHYVVEVAGFECLHFMPVANVLKEDDHVSIRPLMTAEVRARTLTGRDQISDGGQHLVDGVPFGRPYLREPNRPAVHIPPRKRRRLDEGEAAAEHETDPIGLLMANGEPTDEGETASLQVGHARKRRDTGKTRQTAKAVHFILPEVDASDDSEEDDEDFAPEGDKDDDDDDVTTEEDSDNDSDSGSDSDSKSGASSSDASDSSDSSSDSESSSDSDSDSDSDASSRPEVLSSKDGSKTKATPHVPPGEGKSATKFRNIRRTRTNRLRHLKKSGHLPEDATLSDLQKYEEAKNGQFGDEEEEEKPARPFAQPSGKRKRLDEEAPSDVAEDDTELKQRKQELMARVEDTSSTTLSPDKPRRPQSPVEEPAVESVQPPPIEKEPAKRTPSSRRMRPDTSAIGRILARQAAPAVRKAKTKPVAEEPPEPEGASDPDFWKSHINLSAFECWEEDFELSAPPFPFKQHWDPVSKLMREKSTQKKRKRGKIQASPAEEEEEEEEKIILDYDDVPPSTLPDSEINAAIESQLRQDVATAAQADLPSIPEDISILSDLVSSDMKAGAIIICKFFTVNPITVTPEISGYKTATVEQEGDSGPGAGTIQLKIAARDLPKKEKKFDSKGNRIYNAADALLMEDDDDDEGLWEGQFSELLEPKLLKAASTA